jgi:hypothetical protein
MVNLNQFVNVYHIDNFWRESGISSLSRMSINMSQIGTGNQMSVGNHMSNQSFG